MKKCFKIILVFSFLFSFAFARPTKIIHITDINLDNKNASNVQKTIKEINGYKDIDYVVFGGNNLAKTNFDNFEIFLYLLKKVNKKSVVLIGSNDVLSTSGVDKNYYLKRINKLKNTYHAKSFNSVFKKKGIVFITLDGAKQYFQTPNGCYTRETLMWLDRTLKKNKNKNVVILAHFPMTETSSKWLQTARLDEVWEVLAKYKNIKAIISGHYGDNFETKIHGINNIITENYSKSGAYKIIEFDFEDDFIGTNLVK